MRFGFASSVELIPGGGGRVVVEGRRRCAAAVVSIDDPRSDDPLLLRLMHRKFVLKGPSMRTLSLLLTVVVSLLMSSGASASINARAQKLLDRAEESLDREDHVAALEAYIGAVKADSRVADLHALARFTPVSGYSKEELELMPESRKPRVLQLHLQALRQYRELHPDDAEGLIAYAGYAGPVEADAELTEWLSRNPRDAEIFSTRGTIRLAWGNVSGGLADIQKAAELDAMNPERHYRVGVVVHDTVRSDTLLKPGAKRLLIETGIAALKRAESLRPDYGIAMVYRSLLLRFLSAIEEDDARRAKWTAEADTLRERALALRKRPAVESDETGAPVRIGGDVKAPLLEERVEPTYPEVASKARAGGVAILEIVVDREGVVREARAIKELPFGMTEAALEAVKQWKFRPGTRDGKPVDVIYNVTVRFPPGEE